MIIRSAVYILVLFFSINSFGQEQGSNLYNLLDLPEYDCITFLAPMSLVCSPLEKPYDKI